MKSEYEIIQLVDYGEYVYRVGSNNVIDIKGYSVLPGETDRMCWEVYFKDGSVTTFYDVKSTTRVPIVEVA